jgi:hypothetical protein
LPETELKLLAPETMKPHGRRRDDAEDGDGDNHLDEAEAAVLFDFHARASLTDGMAAGRGDQRDDIGPAGYDADFGAVVRAGQRV